MGETLTHVECIGNWEMLFVDDELEYENHTDRCWPGVVLSIVDEHDIESVERIHVTHDDAYSAGALTTRDLDELREYADE